MKSSREAYRWQKREERRAGEPVNKSKYRCYSCKRKTEAGHARRLRVCEACFEKMLGTTISAFVAEALLVGDAQNIGYALHLAELAYSKKAISGSQLVKWARAVGYDPHK